jgi:uncharacterized protein (TIGR03435 family)
MRRKIVVGLLVCIGVVAMLSAQQPAFEVASIKRNNSGTLNSGIRSQPGGRVTVINMTLRELVRGMYRLQAYQMIDNLGGWLSTERWDVVAKAAEDAPVERLVLMLRTLVADRFKLLTHRETRELPTYELMLARRDGSVGPALRRSSLDCVAQNNACGVIADNGRFKATGRTLDDLARNLAPMVGRAVTNKTGVPGIFDLEFTWNDTDGPSLFTAMQEQLGLKLESQRGPVEVLVIDSAERPVED